MTEFLNILKKRPLLTAALALAVTVLAIKYPQPTYWNKCVLRIILCGAMLFFLYLISGEKTIEKSDKRIGYTFKHLLGFLLYALILGAMSVFAKLTDGAPESGVLLRLVTILVMTLFVGIFEELCFRAILNDAIVYRFRDSKGVFAVSAVVSALIFGAMHVVGSPLSSVLDWAQAVMKTLSCAVMGIAFLILYWKTRNVFAIGLVHGLYDFLGAASLILGGPARIGAGNYVLQGEEGIRGLVTLGLQLIVGVALTLLVWKKVGKTIDFKALRENW